MAHHYGHPGQGGVSGVFRGLALVLAICGTVLWAPQIWPLVDGKAWRLLSGLYEPGMAIWLHFGAEVATWLLVFFALNALLMAAFTAVTILFTKRLF